MCSQCVPFNCYVNVVQELISANFHLFEYAHLCFYDVGFSKPYWRFGDCFHNSIFPWKPQVIRHVDNHIEMKTLWSLWALEQLGQPKCYWIIQRRAMSVVVFLTCQDWAGWSRVTKTTEPERWKKIINKASWSWTTLSDPYWMVFTCGYWTREGLNLALVISAVH